MRLLLNISAIAVSFAIIICGCAGIDNNGDDQSQDTLAITLIQPEEGDTVVSRLNLRADVETLPDYVEFMFDSFTALIDSNVPYCASYNISEYLSQDISATAKAYWGEITRQDDVSFIIYNPECDSTAPVILNGIEIPEHRIGRNAVGCVITISLYLFMTSDENCLYGIDEYGSTLDSLYLSGTSLHSIKLEPLSSCVNLRCLTIVSNSTLDEIDLTPLSGCNNLEKLSLFLNNISSIDLSPMQYVETLELLELYNNPLDSATCVNVCDFIAAHPQCDVLSDCDCGD